jgi:hypothetical protein
MICLGRVTQHPLLLTFLKSLVYQLNKFLGRSSLVYQFRTSVISNAFPQMVSENLVKFEGRASITVQRPKLDILARIAIIFLRGHANKIVD